LEACKLPDPAEMSQLDLISMKVSCVCHLGELQFALNHLKDMVMICGETFMLDPEFSKYTKIVEAGAEAWIKEIYRRNEVSGNDGDRG